MTVRELNVYVQAAGQLRRQEQELTEINLYNLGLVIREMLFSKRAPALEKIFPHLKVTEKDEDMDDEALYRQAAALNRMFGGAEE